MAVSAKSSIRASWVTSFAKRVTNPVTSRTGSVTINGTPKRGCTKSITCIPKKTTSRHKPNINQLSRATWRISSENDGICSSTLSSCKTGAPAKRDTHPRWTICTQCRFGVEVKAMMDATSTNWKTFVSLTIMATLMRKDPIASAICHWPCCSSPTIEVERKTHNIADARTENLAEYFLTNFGAFASVGLTFLQRSKDLRSCQHLDLQLQASRASFTRPQTSSTALSTVLMYDVKKIRCRQTNSSVSAGHRGLWCTMNASLTRSGRHRQKNSETIACLPTTE